MDRFEGLSSEKKIYKRILLSNAFLLYCNAKNIYYHYVIERCNCSDYVGDITLTKFKKGNITDLKKYTEAELDGAILQKYIDKDIYYHFIKPFLLRASVCINVFSFESVTLIIHYFIQKIKN